MDFSRQNRIFNPDKSKINVTILGAGSTGSFIAFVLAKMGIKKIKVVDFDKVEAHNIPNQYYRLKDVGKLKVDALKEIINDFSDTEVETENVFIDKDYLFDLDMNSIVIMCVDTIDSRKVITDLLKDIPIKIIDTRFGGEGFSIHYYETGNEEEVKRYKESLEGTFTSTACGRKSIIYTINSLASEVCNIIKKIQNSEGHPETLRREMKTYRFIERRTKGVF